MKKKITIISIITIIIIITILIITNNKKVEKFYLDDIFYNKGEYIEIDNKDLSKYENKSYILFTYNNYCTFSKPCEKVFKEYMNKYKIDFLSIKYVDFKKTDLVKRVKYAPSVIIVKQGKIIDYLDANKDKDLDKYQDVEKFSTWINSYINLK